MNVLKVRHAEVIANDFIYWLHSNDTIAQNIILEADKRPASTIVTDLQNRNSTKIDGLVPKMNLDREYFAQKNYI